MAKYIHIPKSVVEKGGVLTKKDIKVCYLSDEELQWYLNSEAKGKEILIDTRGLRGLIKAPV